MMRKTREIARLRTRTAFNSEALGPDDAMAVEMQVGELAVARRMLQPHRIDGPAGPGTDFGHLVLEAIWQADLCPDFCTFRSEVRRVGQEWVSTCIFRGCRYIKKTK